VSTTQEAIRASDVAKLWRIWLALKRSNDIGLRVGGKTLGGLEVAEVLGRVLEFKAPATCFMCLGDGEFLRVNSEQRVACPTCNGLGFLASGEWGL